MFSHFALLLEQNDEIMEDDKIAGKANMGNSVETKMASEATKNVLAASLAANSNPQVCKLIYA